MEEKMNPTVPEAVSELPDETLESVVGGATVSHMDAALWDKLSPERKAHYEVVSFSGGKYTLTPAKK